VQAIKYVSMASATSAMGLLLGVLVGLSATPTVGVLVGALVTIMSAVLGFAERLPAGSAAASIEGDANVRRFGVAALCCACLVGVLSGVILRTRDALAPTPKESVERWEAAGYSRTQAQSIVAWRATGRVLNNGAAAPSPASDPKGASVAETVTVEATGLVATPPGLDRTLLFAPARLDCLRLNPADYSDASIMQRAFDAEGGKWQAFARSVEAFGVSQRVAALKAGWSLVFE
jgi:hypothetical protein